jgi:TPR repeat protein
MSKLSSTPTVAVFLSLIISGYAHPGFSNDLHVTRKECADPPCDSPCNGTSTIARPSIANISLSDAVRECTISVAVDVPNGHTADLIAKANAGVPCAQYELSNQCFNAKKYDLSLLLASMAAAQGHIGAHVLIGQTYYYGLGVTKDDAMAARWLQKAAEMGSPVAQTLIGLSYHNGEGVAKDDAEAVRWWLKAANQADRHAEALLSNAYKNGEGVEKNEAEARKWESIAQKNIRYIGGPVGDTGIYIQ